MIVGTAGHIDHGKSALVRALTGVDTDRLKEEKARGISIDLGFAYTPTGDGQVLGFVDAPGHERFVRNMLAGATGIDFVLLVVAADDGVMPQTREHLAILDLLGASQGLVALTKTDLAGPERIAAATAEIRDLLAPTSLAGAEILPVSTVTGAGVNAVRNALLDAARTFRPQASDGRFRLAVDRCFTVAGAGTVVTGAVMSGAVALGDRLVVSPSGLTVRVRSIHAQNRPAVRGSTGERCALNLSGEGVSRHAISRGDVVLDPVLHAPTDRIDAQVRVLASEQRALAHWTPVRLHHATRDLAARVALLEEAPIPPGGSGRIQLVLEQPVPAAAHDRFILRDTSASRTLGGGRFIDLRAPRRRRRTPERLAQLDAMGLRDPAEALRAVLGRWPHFIDLSGFARDRALSDKEIGAALACVPHRRIGPDRSDQLLVSPETWEALAASARAALSAFHRTRPELPGLPLARLAAMLQPKPSARLAAAVVRALVQAGILGSEGGVVRLPSHRVGLGERGQRLWARIAPLLSGEARFRPPRGSEIAVQLRAPEAEVRALLKTLARRRDLVEIALDHYFLRETIDEVARIAAEIAGSQENGQFSAAQLRDRLNNGRKMSIQILEFFDRQRVTIRDGDLRRIDQRRLDLFSTATETSNTLAD